MRSRDDSADEKYRPKPRLQRWRVKVVLVTLIVFALLIAVLHLASPQPRPPVPVPIVTVSAEDIRISTARGWAETPVEQLPKLHVRSRHQCFDIPHGFGVLDVLGSGFTTSHYCVLTNVCLANRQLVLFDDAKKGVKYEFPRQPLIQEQTTVYEGNDAPTLSRALRVWAALQPDHRVVETGVTVIMKHAYCCGHIRHFLEPLSTLRLALIDLRSNASRSAFLGAAHLDPEGRVLLDRVVMAQPTSPAGRLHARNQLALDAALRPAVPSRGDAVEVSEMQVEYFQQDALNRTAATRCFETVVVPGSDYNSFHSLHDGLAFRDDLYRVLTPKKWAEFRRTNDQWWIANEAPDELGFRKKESERIILISIRRDKRYIVDMNLLIEWIREFAAPYGAIVKTIEYGKHSAMSQAVHSQEADVLVALHGADLTNLMFQREGAMVVELNPIFFFESGYYEMARRLGIHYAAWTCTAPSCAFAKDSTTWGTIFTEANGIKYDAVTRVMSIAGTPYQNFTWPVIGYPGHCTACDHFPNLTPFRNHFYNTFRDSAVSIASHKQEFQQLFRGVFTTLKWAASEPATAAK